jgi:hypothetical protein
MVRVLVDPEMEPTMASAVLSGTDGALAYIRASVFLLKKKVHAALERSFPNP